MRISNYKKGPALRFVLIGVLYVLFSCTATQQNTEFRKEKNTEPAVLSFEKESENEE